MPRWPSWRIVVGVVGLALSAPGPLFAQIGRQEVTSLRFEGNREFSSEALSRSIITRETECRSVLFQIIPLCLAGVEFSLDPHYLNPRVLREDYARVYLFYYQRGFRDVVVDTILTRPTESEVEITFRLQEGEPIRVTEVEFLLDDGLFDDQPPREFPDSTVLRDLPIRVGDPLSYPALEATRDTLETRLKNMGYFRPFVGRGSDVSSENPKDARVTFRLDPGPLSEFGNLEVEYRRTRGPEPALDEAEVLRMLPYREGDSYQENLQFEGRRALYNLGIFTQVRDSVVPLLNDSVVNLFIQVEEGDVHRVRTGGGFSTGECVDLEASWSSLNFMGGARRLQVTGRVANVFADPLKRSLCSKQDGAEKLEDKFYKPIISVSLDFTQPYLYSPRNSLSVSLFGERQSIPPAFIREAIGMNLGFTRILAPSTFLGISYRPQLSKLDLAGVLFCSAYLICDRTEIELLKDYNFLSPVSVSFSRDRRNQVLSPTRGYSLAADLEHARKWTGSEFGYTRVISEASWHGETGRGLVIGAHMRGGWVNSKGFESFKASGFSGDILHPEKRFFAGGANSVRGFSQNRLGPRVLYLDDPRQLYLLQGDSLNPLPAYCIQRQVADGSCDAGVLPDSSFLPRPKGGTRLLEGSLELRFPLGGGLWEGATFLDFGQVWDEEIRPEKGRVHSRFRNPVLQPHRSYPHRPGVPFSG